MSKLRGDDDLLSLMDQMSSAQGYETTAAAAKGGATEEEPQATARVRLTTEVEGYSSNRLAGSTMVWNPYIQVSSWPSRTRTKSILAPTNPQVEVLRRRAFERFKSEFRAGLERISVNATAKVGISNLWSELSPVAMMERWHFDTKLQEFLFSDTQGRRICHNAATFTTAQIKSAMDQGMVDPILISTDMKGQRKRKRGEKSTGDSLSFSSATSLLTAEVKFEWTRAWKRIAGEKYNEAELKQILESRKFQKKMSRFSRSVMEAATHVEASFHDQVSKRAVLEARQSGRTSKKSSVPKISVEEEDVYVKFSGLSFRLNLEHYRKLQIMFDRMNPISLDRTAHETAFASCLFCLLCRYDMLQGAGLQSSMHGSVFDVLLQHYGCQLECFASPLNSRYERYCSAFLDTDAPFGSVGSFFDYDFSRGGCFQANPPFATNFIKCMYDTMDAALETCAEPLMFVVFVPAWRETTGWNLLNDSPYLTKHISLSQSSHYYCEGTQHRRKDRYRVASFDTSVFCLQNEAAATKWPIEDTHIDELKTAFSLDPNDTGNIVEDTPSKMESQAPVSSGRPKEDVAMAKRPEDSTTSAEVPTKQKNKKKKRKEKSKVLLEGGEEGAQQLGILNSLGLSEK